MSKGGWTEFHSSKDAKAVRFDILRGRFIRIRDRSRDCSRGRAYIVVDLQTGKLLEDQTEYRPNGRAKGA